MTFRQFTFHNVLRNKRLYAAYFLSSMFSVLVFFVYANFAFHPALASDQLNSSVAKGLHTAEGIIYVFSFFFILYSMSSFLKSRQKEFGMLIMHGMSSIQMRTMIFWENMLIGFGATAGGLGLGLVFSKAILLTAENVLQLEQTLPFYLPVKALLLTAGAFMVLFAAISLFTVVFLRNRPIIELLRGSAKPRPEPKASWLLSLFAILLIGSGYAVSIIAKGMEVIIAFLPVTLVVILGTYLLFAQVSVYAIRWLKQRQSFFWRKTNMLTLADLSFRMKDNARTFFIVSIVSTVAFCAIGSLFGFKSIMAKQVESGHPFALEYKSYTENEQLEAHRSLITQTLERMAISSTAYEAEVSYWNSAGEDGRLIPAIPISLYNHLAEALGMETYALSGNEAVVIFNNTYGGESSTTLRQEKTFASGVAITPIEHVVSGPLPELYSALYAIPDELYASLGAPERTETHLLWDIKSSKEAQLAGEVFSEEPGLTADHSYFFAKAYELKTMMQSYYIVLFIGLFIGVVFFVAAGSFLYFRMYTDLDEDKRKFGAIAKIGLSAKELSKVITRQMLLLFFAPVAVALVHGVIALYALQNMFQSSIFRESLLVLSCFLAIQIVYFLLVRIFYVQNIKRGAGVS